MSVEAPAELYYEYSLVSCIFKRKRNRAEQSRVKAPLEYKMLALVLLEKDV